ncbi:hypothetical protein OZN62_01910 [Aurantiacibacter sp. MUD11]|uniref:hypothetical protein n=1 Tax=Aurantiacibacter sp. MUD11 TaxID=3003265 RepID=UPI0022AA9F01|nr:hypothetical protein [Aurantiacibacter sp. MUD11]WAT18357.1 hypothetical protein OZN62_01910 [Aurantiacibacter sp. MUD11]
MKQALLAAVMAIVLAAVPASAQDKPAQAPPPPVTVRQAAPPMPQALRDAYRDFCGDDHASVSLEGFGNFRVTLTPQRRGPDMLAECADTLEAARLTPVQNIDTALMALSFRPFAPFWPTMEERWGSDLQRLRDQLEEEARDARDIGLGLSMASFVRRDIARAAGLRDLGYVEEALAILDATRDELEQGSERSRQRQEFERTMIAAYRASTVTLMRGDLAAAGVLADFLEGFPEESEYRLNPLINYAAYLAEGGDHDASYRIIRPAYDDFRGRGYSPESYQLGGADREFAWILACNRWHMDKAEAAQPFIDIVRNAPEQPRDEYFAYIKRSTTIQRRMYRCMGDAEGWFAQYADGSLPALDPAWVLLQPASTDDNGPLADWTMPEDIAERFARMYRVLPESFTPALQRWQGSARTAS